MKKFSLIWMAVLLTVGGTAFGQMFAITSIMTPIFRRGFGQSCRGHEPLAIASHVVNFRIVFPCGGG
jgi:hypothetical protein